MLSTIPNCSRVSGLGMDTGCDGVSASWLTIKNWPHLHMARHPARSPAKMYRMEQRGQRMTMNMVLLRNWLLDLADAVVAVDRLYY